MIVVIAQNTAAITALKANGAGIDQAPATAIAERSSCAHCHSNKGPGITRASFAPHLVAQRAGYTAKQLRDYRDGRCESSRMTNPVRILSDELTEELSKYYEKMPRVKNVSRASQDALDSGRELFTTTCSQCYGVDGIKTAVPLTHDIAGLNAVYTIFQLNGFNDSTRTNDPDEVMRQIAKALTEEQIENVADYVQSLQ